MIEVINGVIKRRKLPKVGKLSDGTTVSGYDKLDRDVLLSEGWLDLIDDIPEHDPATEEPHFDGFDIKEDRVVKTYKILPIPEPKMSDVEMLQERIDATEEMIIQIMMEGGGNLG